MLRKYHSRDHVRDKLVCGVHRVLEEVDDDGVETFTQRRESPERLLHGESQDFSVITRKANTYNLLEKLTENADELVIDELTALQ